MKKYWVFQTLGDAEDLTWDGDKFDNNAYELGNCFRTEAEAEAAAEKVKTLLLSLHEEQSLPKLTTEVFSREDCPVWAKYAVVCPDRLAYYLSVKPTISEGNWDIGSMHSKAEGINGKYGVFTLFDSSDWQNSLIENPKITTLLPDWCKVGEWVWSRDNGYGKITVVREDPPTCFVHFNGSGSDFDPESFNNLKQARPRPYNKKEMESLVGRVAHRVTGSYLITAFENKWNQIEIDGVWRESDELMKDWTWLGGEPCCVLEHLNDKGEYIQ